VGILDADGAEPTMMRSYLLDDADLAGIAEQAWRLREAAGTLPDGSAPEAADDAVCRVLDAFGTADALLSAELADALGWTVERLRKELAAVPVKQIWRNGGNAGRGYKRADVEAATAR
jgi:S-DNA-T family DNA segregation ATPase FtsK/SpoIIIE